MTQVKARPPHFALFGNQLDALPKSYTRYLVNGLRESFDLPGVPIRALAALGQEPVRGQEEGLGLGAATGAGRAVAVTAPASAASEPCRPCGKS